MRRSRLLGLVLVIGLLQIRAAAAQLNVHAEGRIVRLHPDGSFEFHLPPDEHPQLRDVFRVLRDGLVVGECVVTEVQGNEGSAAPRTRIAGGVTLADTILYSQHEDSMAYVGRDGWQTFTCEDGGFSVEVPRLTAVTSRRVAVGSDTVYVTEYVFLDDAVRQAYEVLYFDLRPGVEPAQAATEVLKAMAAQRSDQKTRKVDVVGKHPIVVNGLAAEEFDVHSELDGKPLQERARYYVVNGRLFELSVATVRPALARGSYRFLNSFHPRGGSERPQV